MTAVSYSTVCGPVCMVPKGYLPETWRSPAGTNADFLKAAKYGEPNVKK